jgi:hypothetical protein
MNSHSYTFSLYEILSQPLLESSELPDDVSDDVYF